ncbi:MAG: DUF4376 domain-containing protein [Rhodobacteraceae bacterium]|nr:DUF4376 domain-containing protein [Paracoccaceae bacterium]
MMFDIADWYWFVGGDRSRAWSSARARFVNADDPDLQAFTAAGHGVQEINSVAELAQVFADSFPAGMLDVYAADCRFRKETGGVVINGATIATDRGSQAMTSGAFNYVTVNLDKVISYKTAGGFVSLTADQVKAIADAVGAHVQACFDKEAFVLAQIAAGAITSVAEIDAAFAGV